MTSTRNLVCPKCSGPMGSYERSGIIVDQCQDCRGIFLDKGELERMVESEGGGWSGMVGAPADRTRSGSMGLRHDSRDGDDRDRRQKDGRRSNRRQDRSGDLVDLFGGE